MIEPADRQDSGRKTPTDVVIKRKVCHESAPAGAVARKIRIYGNGRNDNFCHESGRAVLFPAALV
jgi:hypothetical protein